MSFSLTLQKIAPTHFALERAALSCQNVKLGQEMFAENIYQRVADLLLDMSGKLSMNQQRQYSELGC